MKVWSLWLLPKMREKQLEYLCLHTAQGDIPEMRRDAVFDKLGPCWTQPALEPVGFHFNVRVLGLLVVPDLDPVGVGDV